MWGKVTARLDCRMRGDGVIEVAMKRLLTFTGLDAIFLFLVAWDLILPIVALLYLFHVLD